MELQLTDFENAAFTVFVALLSRSILFFDLNLYIPISKVCSPPPHPPPSPLPSLLCSSL
jgi:hypothetical protein